MTGEFVGSIVPLSPEAEAQAQFGAMWQDAWKRARVELGNPNLVRTAQLTFDQLCVEQPTWVAPTKEIFVQQSVAAALEPEVFEHALYPWACYVVQRLSEEGPLLIWSAGDLDGSVNRQGKLVAGSQEQERRIVASKVLAQAELKNAVGIAAAEDKFERLFFKGAIDWLIAHGATEIEVVEDKLGNLKQGAELLGDINVGLPSGLVWVRQGIHVDTAEKAPEGVIDLPNISRIDWYLRMRGERKGKIGRLLDFDGVLSDDELRQYYQQMSVHRRLQSLGWLHNTRYETAS